MPPRMTAIEVAPRPPRPRGARKASSWAVQMGLTLETTAFLTCLFCVFVDIMGQQFLSPVIVPYAQSLNASLSETGMVMTAEFVALLVSQFLMSWVADTKGRRLVVCVSMAGSALVGRFTCSLRHLCFDCFGR